MPAKLAPHTCQPPAPLTRGRGAAPTPRARCRLPCDARPGVSSPGELARWPCARRAPEPRVAGPVRMARPGCLPPPRPAPAAGLCPGLRKGAPPALGAHQQTVMELAAGRLRPALARPSRPPGAPLALLGPSLPACAPSCPPLLCPAQGTCPQTRRSEARAASRGQRGKHQLARNPGFEPLVPKLCDLGPVHFEAPSVYKVKASILLPQETVSCHRLG